MDRTISIVSSSRKKARKKDAPMVHAVTLRIFRILRSTNHELNSEFACFEVVGNVLFGDIVMPGTGLARVFATTAHGGVWVPLCKGREVGDEDVVDWDFGVSAPKIMDVLNARSNSDVSIESREQRGRSEDKRASNRRL